MAKRGADGRNDQRIACIDRLPLVGHPPGSAGVPARILIPANSLPSAATPLQGAPNPPLRGFLPSCQALCGGGTPAFPGGVSSRGVVPPPRAWPNAALVAVTTIESPALTAYPGWSSTRERGRLARILIPANSLPSAAIPLQGRTEPAFTGFSYIVPGLCAGGDARVPGWSCAGETPALPGGVSSRGVVPPPRAWPNAALMAVTTIESPVLTAYPGWSSTRERGRPARILIPANSLPSAATPLQGAPKPAFTGFFLHRARSCAGETPAFPGGPVRAGRPRSRVVLCGRDARVPGWGFLHEV